MWPANVLFTPQTQRIGEDGKNLNVRKDSYSTRNAIYPSPKLDLRVLATCNFLGS
jgi:hypothetical protein